MNIPLLLELNDIAISETNVTLSVVEHREDGIARASVPCASVALAKRIAKTLVSNIDNHNYYELFIDTVTTSLVFTSDTPKWLEV